MHGFSGRGRMFGGGMGGRGGGMGGGGGRPGGGRRIVASTELRALLLSLIADAPRHGYDLIRSIEELSGGAYAPSPGVVYPALAMLEDQGQIVADSQAAGRKAFAITPAGEAEVAARVADVAALKDRLGRLAAREPGANAPVRRAMDNLKMALGTALGGDDAERPHEIAALIDETVRKIERLA